MTDSPPETQTVPTYPWPVVAAATWVLPGLGHFMLGERTRGVIVGAAVLFLFFSGMVIGGVDVVDRRGDFTLAGRNVGSIWFVAQAMVGPTAFATDFYRQRLDDAREKQADEYYKVHGLAVEDYAKQIDAEEGSKSERTYHHMLAHGVEPVYRTSVGRPSEIGTLYTALAGALNLLVLLDAVARSLNGSKFKGSKFKEADKPAGGSH